MVQDVDLPEAEKDLTRHIFADDGIRDFAHGHLSIRDSRILSDSISDSIIDEMTTNTPGGILPIDQPRLGRRN